MLFRSLCVLFLYAAAAFGADGKTPRPAPDFVIFMNDGSQIHLGQYHGKVVAVAFILTSCPHCQFTSGVLSKLQTEYGPRGLQVVASAIDTMSQLLVPDFVKKFQPSFPVGFNEREAAEAFLEHPTIYRLMMPQLVFIDRKGLIRAQYSGDDKFFDKTVQEKNIRETIEPLLNEKAVGERVTGTKKKPA